MAKEFGEARGPLVTNAAVLEAYVSIVAHMSTSVGVNLFVVAYLSNSAEVR